jgi:UDP-N-acetylglucosamine--N-acetylmuramyl-(pentapeptide) pyrophosphoryl-undecaprenol N-acetylglucosamine transferase
LEELNPDIVFSAGGYVSVPLIWLAAIKKIPTWIHQLDVEPLLANRLMAPLSTRISVTWERSLKDWPLSKTVVAGGLIRESIRRGARDWFVREKGLASSKPTLLVIGGGTGAQSINEAMEVIADELLSEMNVIHLTGIGKMPSSLQKKGKSYQVFELLDAELPHAYAAADLVVARAGMGTISELVALAKPMILLPIPGSAQIANANALSELSAAQVLLSPTPQILGQAIKHLMRDVAARQKLSMFARRAFQTNAASQIVREAATWLK